MDQKPNYEELEQKVKELEKESIERRSLEHALRKSQECLELAVDGANLAMWDWSVDTGKVEYSHRWAEMLGYFPEEIKPNVSAWEELVHPEDMPKVMQKVSANLEGFTSFYECEHRLKTKSGEWRWVLARGKVVERDTDGKPLRHTGTQFDINDRVIAQEALKEARDALEQKVAERTAELVNANKLLKQEVKDRKRVEEALRDSKVKYRKLYDESREAEEVYRSLLHSSADAIVLYDLEGRAHYVSPAFTQLFGWTFKELKGDKIPFLPESEFEATLAIIKEVVENGKPCQGFETKRYTKDGHLLDVSISASRYNDHEGKPVGTLVILRDISERRKLEAQLQHAQRMEAIGTLAGGIAHDFNNLMMGMLGNISLMMLDTKPSHSHYDKLKKIEKMIESGSKLTNQLLGYARKGKYEVKPIMLNQIVKESSETFGRTRKEITIHKNFAEDLHPIEVDETQIHQVLMNLYVNAADAMPGGGDLVLTTANGTHNKMKDKPYDVKPGNYVMLKVTDNGMGMDEKTMQQIFNPFFTTKEMGRGTGLGLASTYGIIKGHGGYIDVESKKGLGASFYIYLLASNKTIPKINDTYDQIMEGGGTILLVDDEEMVLNVGAEMLKKVGYKVLIAKSGKEVMEVYKENVDKIDLVILDMIMPGIGGGEAYDKMKEINPKVKALLSSGYSIDGQATEILERGCNGFIQKPFNLKDLSQKIREILDKS